MPSRRLTDAQRAEIAERREAGESYAAIAEAVGCSASNVKWICLVLGAEPPNPRPLPAASSAALVMTRNGFAVRHFTPEEDARLLALEAEGRTHTEIGRVIGRKPNSVRGRLMTLARREAREEAA